MPTVVHTTHASWTLYLCVPVIFADNAGKVSVCDSAMQLHCGCVGISPVFFVATGLIEMLLMLFFVCNAV